MAQEIERKFLVDPQKWKTLGCSHGQHLRQGYLFNQDVKSCRIRIINNQKAVLNFKRLIDALHRFEYEIELPLHEARILLDNLGENFIEKTRFEVMHQNKCWEVDVFAGSNDGLIVAEIELQAADANFALPDWVTEEVTHDYRYLNTNLALNPYKNWKKYQKNDSD